MRLVEVNGRWWSPLSPQATGDFVMRAANRPRGGSPSFVQDRLVLRFRRQLEFNDKPTLVVVLS
jgi:hypothetical protein